MSFARHNITQIHILQTTDYINTMNLSIIINQFNNKSINYYNLTRIKKVYFVFI